MPKLKAKLELLKSIDGSSTVDLNEVSARYDNEQPTPLSSEWSVTVCCVLCVVISTKLRM